jgi:hypothetical protein
MPSAIPSALYYPYLDISDHRWLNLAALYYDHLWRIVPPNYDVWDHSDDVLRYVDAGFLRNRSTGSSAKEVAKEFEKFLTKALDTEEKKTRLANDLRLSRGIKHLSVGKMAFTLAQSLKAKGLLTEDGADWYKIQELTGALYMLFLAKKMAGDLPLVSDDPAFAQLVYGTPAADKEKAATGGRTHRLASVVLKTVVPDHMAGFIPAEKILEIRKQTEEERSAFHDAIAALGSDLETIRDPLDAEDAMRHRQSIIMRNIKAYRAKLTAQNIGVTMSLMGLSVPSVATSAWGFDVKNAIVLTGLGAIVSATFIAKTIADRRSSKLENHWSYLYTLRAKLSEFSIKEDVIGLHLS